MSLSLYLAQVVGLYLILMGLILLVKRQAMMRVVTEMAKNRALIYTICVIELAAGLALVVAHNVWAWNFQVIITIVGWLLLLEAVAYLMLPYRVFTKWVSWLNKKSVYWIGGFLAVALGLYLTNIGFNLF
ncbi:MAG: hypothetical protein A2589_01595 [Candidatus Vogelbacteria bacterium RIFOXYD1_FULL_46_19]|jgi:hypothetical protein|uniref:DUF2065 domain-containing protein n=1 Tax=Candidatus Vogelbacteria bacterium RIFOXYD1_FULL_46_19 TaxID=1802439 RepID=A0A1G2QGB6_9BACT|nr:MAG: hypothetical protein A2589_01595 [Candidatus Vogelbacteria bacterium RIFOXYD1_FULL_46_19]